jgi:hypothetical protein
MNNEEINKLHPDRETALEVAVEMLQASLADTRSVINLFIGYQVISETMVEYKNNCRAVFDRTSDEAMLEQHPNVG